MSEYMTHLAALGIDPTGVHVQDDGTVAATLVVHSGGGSATMDLPLLTLAEQSDGAGGADLVLLAKHAEGGMGQIWSATQPSLARRVAVKRARRDRTESRRQLVQEGRTLGSLEHPNIVPVHALGRTSSAEPLVVMKYIEGTAWKELLEPLYTREKPAADQVVERHLGILVQVCHAVEFAHARGVVHRDLKPENVMIGAFGEVYVLDWGLALSVRDHGELPRARDVRTLAGTPTCMAPEMAACAGERIDTRTDVYLLGALLHRLVTGRPRHDASDPIRQLELAYRSDPIDYEPWVPEELAEVCNKATAFEPAQRYADVGSFREAITAFLRHRSSRSLVDGAFERLHRLELLLAAAEDGTVATPGSFDALLGEADFGLQQALVGWPENPQAHAGQQRLRELAIEVELRRENAERARVLIAELPQPRPDLTRRLNALETELMRRAGAMKSLERLRFESDLAVQARSRRWIALGLGTVLGLAVCGLFVLRIMGVYEAGYLAAVILMTVFTLGSLGTRLGASSVRFNAINRQVLSTTTLTSAGAALQLALCWIVGIDFNQALALVMLTCCIAAWIASVSIDRRLVWTSVCFFAGAVGVAIWPQLRGLVVGLASFAAFAAGAWAWRKLEAEEAARINQSTGV